MLTNKGKQQVLRLLSSQAFILGQSIVVGIGTTPATASDDGLAFEVSRSLVTVVSPDYTNNTVVFKTTLPMALTGTIREIGLWSVDSDAAAGQYGSRMLFSFDPAIEVWPEGTVFNTTHARIGPSAMRLVAEDGETAEVTIGGFNMDLLGYSDSDAVKIALNSSANVDAVRIRLGMDSSNYYETTIEPSSGYQIITKTRGDFTAVGEPSWSALTSASFYVDAAGGTGTVDFDGVRIEDADTFNPEYFLVSRQVLQEPIEKLEAVPMDIEYTLSLEFEDE